MRVLVTGAGGFVGRHLMARLAEAGHEVVGTTRRPVAEGRLRAVDLRDRAAALRLLEEVRPAGVVHLAGLAFVPAAEGDLELAVSTNVMATAVLLEAASQAVPGCRLLHVSSGEVYGRRRGAEPIAEETPPDPSTAYSVTKLAAEQLARHVGAQRGLAVVVARPFNHVGPGQSELFVAPAFARQIAEAERGLRERVVKVGNLEARRDLTDVRDVVRAYASLLERGAPGEVYNVCSGATVRMREVLDHLLALARVRMDVATDPARMRPSDLPVFCGSPARIRRELGWAPTRDLRATLADVLEDWRERLSRRVHEPAAS